MSELENIEIEYDASDFPNISNAFIISAERDGVQIPGEELDEINQDTDFLEGLVLDIIL